MNINIKDRELREEIEDIQDRCSFLSNSISEITDSAPTEFVDNSEHWVKNDVFMAVELESGVIHINPNRYRTRRVLVSSLYHEVMHKLIDCRHDIYYEQKDKWDKLLKQLIHEFIYDFDSDLKFFLHFGLRKFSLTNSEELLCDIFALYCQEELPFNNIALLLTKYEIEIDWKNILT